MEIKSSKPPSIAILSALYQRFLLHDDDGGLPVLLGSIPRGGRHGWSDRRVFHLASYIDRSLDEIDRCSILSDHE